MHLAGTWSFGCSTNLTAFSWKVQPFLHVEVSKDKTSSQRRNLCSQMEMVYARFKDSPDTRLLFIILLWTNFTFTFSFSIFKTHTSHCDRRLGNTQVCLSYVCLNNLLFKKLRIIHWLYIKWQGHRGVTERLVPRSAPSWSILGQEYSIIGCMRWTRQWKKMFWMYEYWQSVIFSHFATSSAGSCWLIEC